MATNVEQRHLGKSDLVISPVGLGCWQFSKGGNLGGKYWPVLEDEVIRDIVKICLEGGINWFDTAEMYGNGNSERNLAKGLQAMDVQPGEVTIATKWWPMFRTASNIGKTIDERLACLDPYPIDLYQVHQPWGFSGVESEMAAMAKLVRSMKIKNIGVSNFSAKQMRRAWVALQKEGINLISNQVRYNLLDRRIETNGILETAKELGITIIAYSPLAQGLVTGKFHDNPELVRKIGFRRYTGPFRSKELMKSRPVIDLLKNLAQKYQVTPSQIALNWLVNYNGETVVAIPGATKASHAAENVGAMRFMLEEPDLKEIDKVSRIFTA